VTYTRHQTDGEHLMTTTTKQRTKPITRAELQALTERQGRLDRVDAEIARLKYDERFWVMWGLIGEHLKVNPLSRQQLERFDVRAGMEFTAQLTEMFRLSYQGQDLERLATVVEVNARVLVKAAEGQKARKSGRDRRGRAKGGEVIDFFGALFAKRTTPTTDGEGER